jgi:hypothetical protein
MEPRACQYVSDLGHRCPLRFDVELTKCDSPWSGTCSCPSCFPFRYPEQCGRYFCANHLLYVRRASDVGYRCADCEIALRKRAHRNRVANLLSFGLLFLLWGFLMIDVFDSVFWGLLDFAVGLTCVFGATFYHQMSTDPTHASLFRDVPPTDYGAAGGSTYQDPPEHIISPASSNPSPLRSGAS